MNSKQRRRLRKRVLPEFANLIATKRVTGELHPRIDLKRLVAAAAKNPQRIKRVAGYVAIGAFAEALEYSVVPTARGARTRWRDLNNKPMRAMFATVRTVTGCMTSGTQIQGQLTTKMIIGDALSRNFTDDSQLDAAIYAQVIASTPTRTV